MVLTKQKRKDPNGRRDDWETPDRIFVPLNGVFKFKLDAAASKANALCKKFFDEKANALLRDWAPGPVFINPPYTRTELWARKIITEAKRGVTIAALLPNSSEVRWYHELWAACDYLLNIRGRIVFELNNERRGTPFQGSTIFLLNTGRLNLSPLDAIGDLSKPVRRGR